MRNTYYRDLESTRGKAAVMREDDKGSARIQLNAALTAVSTEVTIAVDLLEANVAETTKNEALAIMQLSVQDRLLAAQSVFEALHSSEVPIATLHKRLDAFMRNGGSAGAGGTAFYRDCMEALDYVIDNFETSDRECAAIECFTATRRLMTDTTLADGARDFATAMYNLGRAVA